MNKFICSWMKLMRQGGRGPPNQLRSTNKLKKFSLWVGFIDLCWHKIKKYYNCIFSIECNLRKHGAVTNQFPSILFQRQENWLRNWIGWPAVWRKRSELIDGVVCCAINQWTPAGAPHNCCAIALLPNCLFINCFAPPALGSGPPHRCGGAGNATNNFISL